MTQRFHLTIILCVFLIVPLAGQSIKWSNDGSSYYRIEQNEVIQYRLPDQQRKPIISTKQLAKAANDAEPLKISKFWISDDGQKMLLYTNTKRVWRIHSRGDYWVADLPSGKLQKLGKSLPSSSLMFAKFSPDNKKVAYVSEYNLYVEDLATNAIKQLTSDGNRKFINGTFDWVYEEEFAVRDGFRWSNDSKALAYWQIDARETKDFYMINYTDSVYSRIIPVEYPKVGQRPSAARIGVVNVTTAETKWMDIEGNPRDHYLVRLEYIPNTNDILVQQLNRKQNASKLIRCNTATGKSTVIQTEKDAAWVEVLSSLGTDSFFSIDFAHRFDWINNGKEFLWISEKDGWRHLYRISVDGKNEMLVTKGNYDVTDLKGIDEKNSIVYFIASPENATQRYLYKVSLSGKGKSQPERITPRTQQGTHNYNTSPNGQYANHTFSNAYTKPAEEWISLAKHKPLKESESIESKLSSLQEDKTTEFFKVKTADGVEMDGWVVKPRDFDPSKKYPVVFFVYTEPWGSHVKDEYGTAVNNLYKGDMREDGYIYVSVDNRGTPVPKGRAWRKSIYRKIGIINIQDQAMAAKEILKWPFVDTTRVAVWGWSGGGSATLNLMFRYPDIYKTGISIAAVGNQLTYDNIYQERYMGLPQENLEDFIKGSPITYAKGLKGNLLYVHGTGDDNVHYANAEMLLNELIKYNKQFQFMAYPNRSHSISEGEGTTEHLMTLYTNYLKKYCPPGAR